ncbi:MAG: AMP-binding protein [Alicyclobacillus sp.]|nr:AMP-binding protein [Alicyclobacillus sp.]
MTVTEGTLLWTPSEQFQQNATLTRYIAWLRNRKGIDVRDVNALWHWSVTQLEDFWESVWQFFNVESETPYEKVLDTRKMPGARWFQGARLNYAKHIFRQATDARHAIYYQSESQPLATMSWAELQRRTAAVANYLRQVGVEPGDRVAAYIHNGPEAVIGFLAAASIGAVWSSCATEFGIGSALNRFQQIAPKVLIAVEGYQYNGRWYDRRAFLRELQAGLPTLTS